MRRVVGDHRPRLELVVGVRDARCSGSSGRATRAAPPLSAALRRSPGSRTPARPARSMSSSGRSTTASPPRAQASPRRRRSEGRRSAGRRDRGVGLVEQDGGRRRGGVRRRRPRRSRSWCVEPAAVLDDARAAVVARARRGDEARRHERRAERSIDASQRHVPATGVQRARDESPGREHPECIHEVRARWCDPSLRDVLDEPRRRGDRRRRAPATATHRRRAVRRRRAARSVRARSAACAIVAATRLRSTVRCAARISPIEMAPVTSTNDGVQSRLFTSIVDSHSSPSTSAHAAERDELAQPASTEQVTGQPSDEHRGHRAGGRRKALRVVARGAVAIEVRRNRTSPRRSAPAPCTPARRHLDTRRRSAP